MKKMISARIDSDVLEGAKEKGINISQLLENELKDRLRNFEQLTIPSNCDHKWTWPFTSPYGLAKECKKCGIIKRVILESYEETKKSMKKTKEMTKEEKEVSDEIEKQIRQINENQ